MTATGHAGWVALAALGASACIMQRSEPGPAPAPRAPPAEPVLIAASDDNDDTDDDAEAGLLYGPEAALADLLHSPLIHIGTGPWHGIMQFHACAYRNERVIVVDVYCAQQEKKVFSLEIFSPTRGRSRIYAEGDAPITSLRRDRYTMWTVEAEEVPPIDRVDQALTLDISSADLRVYTEQRYNLRLRACYRTGRQNGCLREWEQHERAWDDVSNPFYEEPTESWYQVMGLMRSLAKINGT